MPSAPGWLLGGIMFAAGTGIPVMAALNAGLGERLGSSLQAALILFAVALAVTAVLLVSQLQPVRAPLSEIPAQYFTGGLLIAFYLLSVTAIAPRLGVGNAIFLVLLGQLLAASAIDHFGLLGVVRTSLTPQRLLGLLLMAAGILLARRSGV